MTPLFVKEIYMTKFEELTDIIQKTIPDICHDSGAPVGSGYLECRAINFEDVLQTMDIIRPGHKLCFTSGGSIASIAAFAPVYYVHAQWALGKSLSEQAHGAIEYLHGLICKP